MDTSDDLKKILNLILKLADFQAVSKGKERQSAIWKKENPDYLPLILSDWETPELEGFKHWSLKEQFYDKEKMLFEQLKGLIGIAKTHSDAQLSIRVNMGVGIIASIFGLKPVFPQDDQMPWFVGHFSKEHLWDIDVPSDLKNRGLIPLILEYLQYFRENLPEEIKIYCFDTQGPFDIAHLIRGHEIYTDLYDDPDFAHHLLKISTKLYIEVTKLYKETVGEPLNSGYHNTLYMDRGGVRLCDDSSVNLSPALFQEFSLPYIKEALAPFGGGWVHFCGDANHLLDMYLELEEVQGLNFGNPEKYDYEKVMRKIVSKGKFYVGYIPKKEDESLREYFIRLLLPLEGKRGGLILQMVRGSETSLETIEIWHEVQDSYLKG